MSPLVVTTFIDNFFCLNHERQYIKDLLSPIRERRSIMLSDHKDILISKFNLFINYHVDYNDDNMYEFSGIIFK